MPPARRVRRTDSRAYPVRLDMLQPYDADGRDAGSAVRMPLTDKWIISNSRNDDPGDAHGEERARELLWQMANGDKPYGAEGD
jgi:hypothetical protein